LNFVDVGAFKCTEQALVPDASHVHAINCSLLATVLDGLAHTGGGCLDVSPVQSALALRAVLGAQHYFRVSTQQVVVGDSTVDRQRIYFHDGLAHHCADMRAQTHGLDLAIVEHQDFVVFYGSEFFAYQFIEFDCNCVQVGCAV